MAGQGFGSDLESARLCGLEQLATEASRGEAQWLIGGACNWDMPADHGRITNDYLHRGHSAPHIGAQGAMSQVNRVRRHRIFSSDGFGEHRLSKARSGYCNCFQLPGSAKAATPGPHKKDEKSSLMTTHNISLPDLDLDSPPEKALGKQERPHGPRLGSKTLDPVQNPTGCAAPLRSSRFGQCRVDDDDWRRPDGSGSMPFSNATSLGHVQDSVTC